MRLKIKMRGRGHPHPDGNWSHFVEFIVVLIAERLQAAAKPSMNNPYYVLHATWFMLNMAPYDLYFHHPFIMLLWLSSACPLFNLCIQNIFTNMHILHIHMAFCPFVCWLHLQTLLETSQVLMYSCFWVFFQNGPRTKMKKTVIALFFVNCTHIKAEEKREMEQTHCHYNF